MTLPIPLVLVDLLRGMGVGEQVTVALLVGIVLIYLFRGRKVASAIAGVVGTAWLVAMGIGVFVIAMLVREWADPRPSAFMHDVAVLADLAKQYLVDPGVDWLRDVVA